MPWPPSYCDTYLATCEIARTARRADAGMPSATPHAWLIWCGVLVIGCRVHLAGGPERQPRTRREERVASRGKGDGAMTTPEGVLGAGARLVAVARRRRDTRGLWSDLRCAGAIDCAASARAGSR